MWTKIGKVLADLLINALVNRIGKPLIAYFKMIVAQKEKEDANDKLKDIVDPVDRRNSLP